LRLEGAVHLLKTGNASVAEVAARVGYADGATLRPLLPRRLHVGVKEIVGQQLLPYSTHSTMKRIGRVI